MRTVNLSECTKEGLIFLYDDKTVGLGYVLERVRRGKPIQPFYLLDERQMHSAIELSLKQYVKDRRDKYVLASYPMGDILKTLVVVDITKDDIVEVDCGHSVDLTIKKRG